MWRRLAGPARRPLVARSPLGPGSCWTAADRRPARRNTTLAPPISLPSASSSPSLSSAGRAAPLATAAGQHPIRLADNNQRPGAGALTCAASCSLMLPLGPTVNAPFKPPEGLLRTENDDRYEGRRQAAARRRPPKRAHLLSPSVRLLI